MGKIHSFSVKHLSVYPLCIFSHMLDRIVSSTTTDLTTKVKQRVSLILTILIIFESFLIPFDASVIFLMLLEL